MIKKKRCDYDWYFVYVSYYFLYFCYFWIIERRKNMILDFSDKVDCVIFVLSAVCVVPLTYYLCKILGVL